MHRLDRTIAAVGVLAAALCGGCGGSDELDWVHAWTLIQTEDVEAKLVPPLPGKTGAGVTALFDKTGDQRRLLALQALPGAVPDAARTVDVRYRLTLNDGPAPRMAVIAFESGGGAYFATAPAPLETGKYARQQVAMSSPRPAAFSEDADGRFRWADVDKLWIALVLDAPTRGRLKILGANVTPERWRPRRSLPLGAAASGDWTLAKDKAVRAALAVVRQGPRGRPCMKLEFIMPGGKHMYVLASTKSPAVDLTAYHGLAMKVRARLPAGDVRLLVSLTEEDGAQYYFEPKVGAGKRWRRVAIPFDRFKAAGWAPDKNGRLDLQKVVRVTVGAHGTGSERSASGSILAADLTYVLASDAGEATPARKRPPSAQTKPVTRPTTEAAEPAVKPPIKVEPKPPPGTQPATAPATQPATAPATSTPSAHLAAELVETLAAAAPAEPQARPAQNKAAPTARNARATSRPASRPATTPARATPATQPARYVHAPTGLAFPPKIAKLSYEGVRRFRNPGLGVGVRYRHPSGVLLDLFIYNLGLKHIPSDADSDVIHKQLDQAMADIRAVERQGRYPNLAVQDRGIVSLTLKQGAPQALRIGLSFGTKENRYRSYLYVLGYRSHFVKIRYTYRAEAGEVAEKQLEALTEWLAGKIQKGTATTKPAGKPRGGRRPAPRQ